MEIKTFPLMLTRYFSIPLDAGDNRTSHLNGKAEWEVA
jgi:hypothetical protein